MGLIFKGAGHYIPDTIISNKDLSERYKTDFDLNSWIIEKTGICERRVSNLMPSDQGVIAAEMALLNAETKMDFILVNTIFGDYSLPQTSTIIQHKLGQSDAFAIEINMPCAGPVYSLSLADMILKAGKYRNGLLIGVDKITDIIDPQDYIMNALFGEGAGAIWVGISDEINKGVIDFFLGSSIDSDDENLYSLKILSGKAKYPIQHYDNTRKNHYLLMDGKKVKRFIIEKLNASIDWILKNHISKVSELDFVVTHQANKRVIENCLCMRGISKEKILWTVDDLGNTASASIFITISKHFDSIQMNNKKILICGMGGGLSWGAVYYQT